MSVEASGGHWHADVTQVWPGMQACPHPPQFLGSLVTLTSQPSVAMPLQSPKPELQRSPHIMALQLAVEFGPLAQAVHDAPHVAGSELFAQAPPQTW